MNEIINNDAKEALKTLPDNSINCCVTSPPYYGLRDYNDDRQIGLETTPEEYIQKLVDVFDEVFRVLRSDGTLWLNIADSYNSCSSNQNGRKDCHSSINPIRYYSNGDATLKRKKLIKSLKPKDLIGIPWMLAFALRSHGWYLRQDIIWSKPNPMPESVKDRCTKSHEYIFLLSKSRSYYFNYEAIMEEAAYDGRKDTGLRPQTFGARAHDRWIMKNGEYMRNKHDVWTVCTKPLKYNHFASFPEELVAPCIKAGCPENGIVLDPFFGSGTTGIVARKLNRNYIGCEINQSYIDIANKRITEELGMFK